MGDSVQERPESVRVQIRFRTKRCCWPERSEDVRCQPMAKPWGSVSPKNNPSPGGATDVSRIRPQHVTFGVKGRRRVIRPAIQQGLWNLIADIARSYGVDVRAVSGAEDHVHLLMNLPPKIALANVVRAMKQGSSKWMNEAGGLRGVQRECVEPGGCGRICAEPTGASS